jgi:hypothetical protein
VPARAHARRRALGCAGRRQPGTTVRAPLRPPVPRPLHRHSHPILPCHGPRETDLRRQPTTSPPYARRAAPGRLLAVAPRHRLAHAAAHRAVMLVTLSPRHTAYLSPAVFPRASTRAPPRSPLSPSVSTSLRSRPWPVQYAKAFSRTQRACTPTCSPSLSTCSPEYASRRPPHCCCRRAPPSVRSPIQPTISAHPLGPSEAARATR